jgi:hypothetical protein
VTTPIGSLDLSVVPPHRRIALIEAALALAFAAPAGPGSRPAGTAVSGWPITIAPA